MSKDKQKAVHLKVHGRVQGVGFRYSTVRTAAKCGVTGWVRNAADGSVEILCEGRDEDVERFIAQVKKGPPGARVTDIDRKDVPARGVFSRFGVEY